MRGGSRRCGAWSCEEAVGRERRAICDRRASSRVQQDPPASSGRHLPLLPLALSILGLLPLTEPSEREAAGTAAVAAAVGWSVP